MRKNIDDVKKLNNNIVKKITLSITKRFKKAQ